MTRDYDTSALFREDTLLRTQLFSDEVEAIRKSIDRVERELVSIEKRIRWMKKVEDWRLGRR